MDSLRKLLGNTWVDRQLLGANPTHALGRWQKSDPSNIWVPYVDGLVEFLLTDARVKWVGKDLRRKLQSEFTSTVVELETAVFLARQGFTVTLEPTAPKKGPDILAEREGVSYFVEIREVGRSWEEDRFQLVSHEIVAALNAVSSRYAVAVTVGEKYVAGSAALKEAMAVLIEALGLVKQRGMDSATLYYAPPDGKLLIPDHGFSGGDPLYQKIVDEANFLVRFRDLGKNQTKTPATVSRKMKFPPEPVKTHERLKSILVEKSSQLPTDSRGILVLDVTEQFMLSDFTRERAFYGDLEISFPPVKGPGEPVGPIAVKSNERGFFGLSARVSAVVIHTRALEGREMKSSWQVYPTNRANQDTIRLRLDELERFGDVCDRKHLAAEDTPNSVQ